MSVRIISFLLQNIKLVNKILDNIKFCNIYA